MALTGSVLGGVTMSLGTASGSDATDSQRFLIDLREIDRADVPDSVEVVHDISEIDVLAARGNPDAVPGANSTVPDIEMQQHGLSVTPTADSETDDGAGPVEEEEETEEDEIAPPVPVG